MTAPNRPPRSWDRAPSHTRPPLPPLAELHERVLDEGLEDVAAEYQRAPHTIRDLLSRAGYSARPVEKPLDVNRPFDPMPWAERGDCRTVDPELFHPHPGRKDVAASAKAICAACPVRTPCLAYALADPSVGGIWGGTTERERARRRRKGAA